MPYPSILWKNTLSEANRQLSSPDKKMIPENVLTDLYLHEYLRPRTLQMMRHTCTAEEIPMRQAVFTVLLEDRSLQEKLAVLREDADDLDRLTGRFDRSESEEERIVLFPAIMRMFFRTADRWTVFSERNDRLGEIGRYFHAVLQNENTVSCRKRCDDILSHRQSAVKLTVRGGQLYASEGGENLRARLEEIFRHMGLEDALPPERHPSQATVSIIKAYAQVYAGFFEMAKDFLMQCGEDFLCGEYDIHEISGYAQEISFLLDTVQYFEKLQNAGYPLCCPVVCAERIAELDAMRDPSLMQRNISGSDVVPNDVRMAEMRDGEKLNFFILSGANGGGKTTYLRAVGLAVLFFITGCPVAAESGRMYPFDAIYTHFPANESFENSGRFVNEAERADAILEAATADSFALFNETYSGTDEKKSAEYSSRLAETLFDRGVFGIYVTHIHALTGGRIPTLAAVVDENDENRRTYKIRRVGKTGSSYAADILEKYRLDRVSLTKRLAGFGKEENACPNA